MYSNSTNNTFKKRAIHNAFILKEEEKNFKSYLKKDRLSYFFKIRAKKNKSYSNFNNYLTEHSNLYP